MAQSKNWCFTLNNYTEEEINHLSTLNVCRYILYGKETGENGTPHLQGFVQFNTKRGLAFVKRTIGERGHYEIARNIADSVRYCKKDGDFTEIGELSTQGKRSDLEAFKQDVKNGMHDKKTLMENHSTVYARYERFVNLYVSIYKPLPDIHMYPLYKWQQHLYNKLILEGTERTILFFVDLRGNSGKTWFAKYFCRLHENAQILLPGKKADMAYMLEEDKTVYFLDCPRSKQGEYIQYDFLEDIKNRYVFSSKYESRIKHLQKNHLVVFLNEQPDQSKLSIDRFEIKLLELEDCDV
jgi:hypothetical protein